jgi:mono/diheme cytochrome c family protein
MKRLMTKRKIHAQRKTQWGPIIIIIIAAIILIGAGSFFLFAPTGVTAITVNAQPISADQLDQGQQVYAANCAACHGPAGEGQLNWRQPDANGVFPAPPHDSSGHTWHHPDQQLLQIIAQGGSMPGSTMLAYKGQLTEAEMIAVLAYIKTFWGPQESQFQAEVTKQVQ